ncbi:MAG: tRNA preQ1(34) S-adenosylmethionine ribosyltransferase-isomerase QueA [Proteobacteria bacterium]|jgi:S-adenosylmethionine:tRNA ribosyltransferase-isomerase|nr:tRNA preQ1(34) S-adenosylmethionine ribosyltransferase-isomerase QueA [Pseudomonadota bacterium]
MTKTYNTSDFNYDLPEELIAHQPALSRDNSRLLVASDSKLLDLQFSNLIDFINENDLVVFNNSKVIKARLFGNKQTGGKIEILIERIISDELFICHIRSNKTIPIGLIICLPDNLQIKIIEKLSGLFKVEIISNAISIYDYLETYGSIPLPHYMNRHATDIDSARYQTVYAKDLGSVAAPTAGLHFTEDLIQQIQQKKAKVAYVTLHVGSGTFKPVNVENISDHKMHSEVYNVSQETIDLIHETKKNGGKVVAVGTTSLRALETIAQQKFKTTTGETDIFITPGYKFQVVDKLITNFHLPKSTLLMLVSAFAGFEQIKRIYQHAIAHKYHFFSYGDAILLTLKIET